MKKGGQDWTYNIDLRMSDPKGKELGLIRNPKEN